MSQLTSSDLLRAAKQRHGVTDSELIRLTLQDDEVLYKKTAKELVRRFVDGGPCSLPVAAALVTLIADRKQA